MTVKYKDYRFGGGKFGGGIVGGVGVEFELFRYRVDGAMIQPSTTGSSQITGTGNGTYLYDITPGLVVVDGKVLEIAAAADQACEAAANIMASGKSKTYLVVAYKKTDNSVATKIVEGAVADTADVEPPSVADIEAAIPYGCPWVAIGSMTINRTGDETVTEVVDNKFRPLLVPKTVHDE